MISHSSEFLVASSDTGRGEAFCWDDRIELDWSGALLDLLLILESFLLSPLGCPHESHALKAPLPFLFFQSFPPSFFRRRFLCWITPLITLLYYFYAMEFLAPFIGVEVLSYFYRVTTKFCLGHFSRFHLFHIIKNSENYSCKRAVKHPGLF